MTCSSRAWSVLGVGSVVVQGETSTAAPLRSPACRARRRRRRRTGGIACSILRLSVRARLGARGRRRYRGRGRRSRGGCGRRSRGGCGRHDRRGRGSDLGGRCERRRRGVIGVLCLSVRRVLRHRGCLRRDLSRGRIRQPGRCQAGAGDRRGRHGGGGRGRGPTGQRARRRVPHRRRRARSARGHPRSRRAATPLHLARSGPQSAPPRGLPPGRPGRGRPAGECGSTHLGAWSRTRLGLVKRGGRGPLLPRRQLPGSTSASRFSDGSVGDFAPQWRQRQLDLRLGGRECAHRWKLRGWHVHHHVARRRRASEVRVARAQAVEAP